MDATSQETPRQPQAASRKRRRNFIKEVIHAIGKWGFIVMVAAIVCLGSMDVYDFLVPETVAAVNNIGGMCPEVDLAHRKNWTVMSDDPEENWKSLQPAIKVLRKVCAPAADWVEDRYDNKKLIWEVVDDGTFAKYDHFNRTLILNSSLVNRRNGDVAVTLAHEYRHSRQNFTKNVKMAIFLMFTGVKLDHFVENDAYHFEKEVYLAIFD